jgi:hypothetical protein
LRKLLALSLFFIFALPLSAKDMGSCSVSGFGGDWISENVTLLCLGVGFNTFPTSYLAVGVDYTNSLWEGFQKNDPPTQEVVQYKRETQNVDFYVALYDTSQFIRAMLRAGLSEYIFHEKCLNGGNETQYRLKLDNFSGYCFFTGVSIDFLLDRNIFFRCNLKVRKIKVTRTTYNFGTIINQENSNYGGLEITCGLGYNF